MNTLLESGNAAFHLPFAPGDIITNKTLYTTFRCACEGGIRYSSTLHLLVLVSNFIDPRHTGGTWSNNILYYTGSGRAGDQDINKGANKRLLESLQNATPIYYFEVYTQVHYTYRGKILPAGDPFQKVEPDSNGNQRKVWIFPLRLAN